MLETSEDPRQLRLVRAEKDRRRERELERCKTDLWYLATRYLGYKWNPNASVGGEFPGKGLTERLHKPLCRWYDFNRDSLFMGLWMSRWHHKTTLIVCQIVQDILINPCVTLFYFHAVDDEAAKLNSEVAHHLLKNDKLRALDPVGVDENGKRYRVFPAKNSGRRAVKTDRVEVNRHRFSRFPTLLARGIMSEVTGAHANKAYLDDIIGRSTVENSQLGKVRDCVQNTILPVVDDTVLRVTGTPWSYEGVYKEWQQDPQWKTIIVPGSPEEPIEQVDWTQPKIHLTPDYELKHPVYGPKSYEKTIRRKLTILQKQMRGNFPPQIMCDPEPASEMPWDPKACEHFTSVRPENDMPGIVGDGVVFVLSDPAPMYQGGADQWGERFRGDGSKDYWSLAVLKVLLRKNRRYVVLITGAHSQMWEPSVGCEQAAQLMKRWVTAYFISEQAKAMQQPMEVASAKVGASVIRGSGGLPLQFRDYNKKDGKNQRFTQLADLARQRDFWVCEETCSPEFLRGDGVHTGFLTQARRWRKVGPNKNSLRFDDDADVVSRITDPVITEFSPQPHFVEEPWKEHLRREEWEIEEASSRCDYFQC